MPTVIKLKRGTTTPTTSNIVSGEIAVDTSAQKLYINDASTIKTIGLGNPSVSDISDLTATATELNYLDGVTGITLGSANELLIVGSDGTSITSDSTLSIDTGSNYIGINQTSPEVTLHMTGEGAQTAQIRMEQYNDSADAPDVRTRRYRGTIASPSAVQSGDYLFRSNHEYYNGTSLLIGGAFAFDNTNNANRTEYRIAVDTDGTGGDILNGWQFKIDGNDSGAITFNNAYKFPTSDGSANQFLQTNGSGALSFASATVSDISDLTATAAELNILDGVTSTAAELNIMDGDTAATSTTLADADRVVVNDAGTMKQVALTDFETYFETALDTLSNVTSLGTLNGITIASTQTIDMGANRVTNVTDPVGNQDAATKAYVDANAGGGASGFTNSTFTTAPGADGDYDLSYNNAQTVQESPFEAGGSDAFGISLGEVYDQMEPTGSLSSVDLGAFT